MKNNRVDFTTLNAAQLRELQDKWFREAMSMERKLDGTRGTQYDYFFRIANIMWKRVGTLERWINRNALSPRKFN